MGWKHGCKYWARLTKISRYHSLYEIFQIYALKKSCLWYYRNQSTLGASWQPIAEFKSVGRYLMSFWLSTKGKSSEYWTNKESTKDKAVYKINECSIKAFSVKTVKKSQTQCCSSYTWDECTNNANLMNSHTSMRATWGQCATEKGLMEKLHIKALIHNKYPRRGWATEESAGWSTRFGSLPL